MIQNRIHGSILAARHSFMPNRLGYCGPDENEVLLDALITKQPSERLTHALEAFQGAYPYYRFIAESQGIPDTFDYRVVEAYWLGNDVLDKIPPSGFYEHLRKRLEKKFPKEHIKKLFEARPFAAFPHHALHVFNAFSTMGTVPDAFAQATGPDDKVGLLMDKCRISWGKVVERNGGNFVVEYEPVIRRDGLLSLARPVVTKVVGEVNGQTLLPEARPSDWISFHWGFACTVLTPIQLANLRKYTISDMAIANTVPVPR